jgi:predicted ATPase
MSQHPHNAAQGMSQPRMLREIAGALEAFALELPIVLLLEDLHWSDASTIDLIAVNAQRIEPARLMSIGTYRPSDARDLKAALSKLANVSLRFIWFTEGFHTLALGEARLLLEELGYRAHRLASRPDAGRRGAMRSGLGSKT